MANGVKNGRPAQTQNVLHCADLLSQSSSKTSISLMLVVRPKVIMPADYNSSTLNTSGAEMPSLSMDLI
jgi:hypothetical protein